MQILYVESERKIFKFQDQLCLILVLFAITVWKAHSERFECSLNGTNLGGCKCGESRCRPQRFSMAAESTPKAFPLKTKWDQTLSTVCAVWYCGTCEDFSVMNKWCSIKRSHLSPTLPLQSCYSVSVEDRLNPFYPEFLFAFVIIYSILYSSVATL